MEYLAIRVVQAYEKGGVEAGQAKYRSYFEGPAKQKLYGRYQPATDEFLEQMGHQELIVSL